MKGGGVFGNCDDFAESLQCIDLILLLLLGEVILGVKLGGVTVVKVEMGKKIFSGVMEVDGSVGL